MTNAERSELMARFDALPSQLRELIGALSPEQLVAHPIPGEWSVAQVVHHLADSRMVSFTRVKLLLSEANASWGAYDEAAWAALPDGDTAAVEDSLAILSGLHARWHHLLIHLTGDDWARTGYHTVTHSVSTLEELMRRYTSHGETHLEQIHRLIAAMDQSTDPPQV